MSDIFDVLIWDIPVMQNKSTRNHYQKVLPHLVVSQMNRSNLLYSDHSAEIFTQVRRSNPHEPDKKEMWVPLF